MSNKEYMTAVIYLKMSYNIYDTPTILFSYTAVQMYYTSHSVNYYRYIFAPKCPLIGYLFSVTKPQGQSSNKYLSVMNIHLIHVFARSFTIDRTINKLFMPIFIPGSFAFSTPLTSHEVKSACLWPDLGRGSFICAPH